MVGVPAEGLGPLLPEGNVFIMSLPHFEIWGGVYIVVELSF